MFFFFFGNPLKSKPLYTFCLRCYFPGACRKHLFIIPGIGICILGISPRFSRFLFIFSCRLFWPVSNLLPVPPQGYNTKSKNIFIFHKRIYVI